MLRYNLILSLTALARFAASSEWQFPQETGIVDGGYPTDGWTPKPTSGAFMFKRAVSSQDSICGYLDGDPSKSLAGAK
jgi:hypothetical protein